MASPRCWTVDGRYVPVPSEACHIGFGPVEEDELAFWPFLERARGRVTTESVISGPGLVRVHKARAAAGGQGRLEVTEQPSSSARWRMHRATRRRPAAALSGWLRRFAGDIAITFLATGGVTLAGGILPRIRGLIDAVEFRRVFEAKAPVDALARWIGTRLVIEPDAVLAGMAAFGAAPGIYGIDYEKRLWQA